MSQIVTGNSTSPAVNSSASQPSFAWTIDDNTDLLQLGYGGSLTLQALTLYLPEPCCVMITLVGSWFFSNQPLPWNIFGVVLPGAFSVQAVQVPQLNAPAYFTMNNVSLVYASCGADFAAAAQLLVSTASADTENLGGNSLSFDASRNSLYCQTCVFQGSQQVPSAYSNAVSIVSLLDTHIVCLPSNSSNATAANAAGGNTTATGQSSAGSRVTTDQTSAAGWAPPVWLPVLLAFVCCTMVALGVFAVWRHFRKNSHAREFSNLHEAKNIRMPRIGKAESPSAYRIRSAVRLAADTLTPHTLGQ